MIDLDFTTLAGIAQIIFADIILSGDNALVIGMAAAGLPEKSRKRAIFFGMAMAAGLRICFAVIATFLISIKGILFFGGLLLAWVCWRFFQDIRVFNHQMQDAGAPGPADSHKGDDGVQTSFARAMMTILLADVSMSIDNIVAVAAIARDDTYLLVFGLALAILLMAFCASLVMKIMLRYRSLSWLGLVFLVYLSGAMIFDGLRDLMAV